MMKQNRKGSRKGSEYDLIDNIISVAEREYGDLEDLTQTQADKVCETVAGMTGESVDNVKAQLREMDELNGVTRQGSRKGSSLITSENQFIDYFASLGYDPEYVRNNVLQEFRYEIHSGGLSVEEIDDYLSYAASDILRKGSRKGEDFTAGGIKTVANTFKDITTKKIPDAIGKITGEREGSRNGSTVQQVIDVFDDPDVPDEELLRIARELPDGVGEEVLKSLFVGSWRGDDPVEKEFFKIIESKISRNGSRKESRSGGIQDEIKNYLSGTNYATSDDDEEIEGILDNLSGHLQSQGYSADDAENGIGYYQDPYDSYQEPKLGARKGDSRKGSSVSSTGNFPTCDLDSTSGKGSRPSDLGSIASKIASGRNRSINVPGEYEE